MYLQHKTMEGEVVCPKCHSNQIKIEKKGFNSTMGAVGMYFFPTASEWIMFCGLCMRSVIAIILALQYFIFKFVL